MSTICLCNISRASLTFAKDQTLLKIIISRLSTCLWILMIFALAAMVAYCVVLASFSCLLISFSLSPSFFYIVLRKMPKYSSDVTT